MAYPGMSGKVKRRDVQPEQTSPPVCKRIDACPLVGRRPGMSGACNAGTAGPDASPARRRHDDVQLLAGPDPPAEPPRPAGSAASAAAEAAPYKDPAATAGATTAAPSCAAAAASGAAATARAATTTACAAAAATVSTTATTAAPRQYEVLAEVGLVFLVEDVERRQTDVRNLLLTEGDPRPGILGP
jgi:hypothetical protein